MMRATDTIIGPARGSVIDALNAVPAHLTPERYKPILDYINEVYRLAPLVGIDPSIVVAQSAHETALWTSSWWANRLNPAGIGITGDPQQNAASGTWKNGMDAARAHIVHLWLYAAAGSATPLAIRDYFSLDPRALTVLDQDWAGDIHTINDLTGRWGVDPNYAAGVVARGNQIFPSLPDQQKGTAKVNIPTTHSVKQPPIYDLATDYARFGISRDQATEIILSRFEHRSGADPRFIVCHIQDGITTGSLPYWASPSVDASSTVMIQRDGSILRVVPEQHGPWTNGDVNRPTVQANEILALGGNPNIWSLTMETEGDASNNLTDEERDAVIWQIEDWIMRYPKILNSEWCMLEHAYINSVDRAFCGLYLYGAGVVDAINNWLVGATALPTPPAKPEPPKSPYPQGMTPQMAKRLYGSLTVPWSSKPFTFDLKRRECRYWLAHGAASIPEGGSYQQGHFAKLDDVIRRGDGKTRTFQWGDLLYEQVVKGQ